MKKLIVAGFSLLAVGLLVLSSQANVVGYQTQPKDVVLQVEVTGLPSKKTVRLSDNEYQQFNNYIIEFQQCLNASHSLNETKSLFKKALERFNQYGFLPNGVTPEFLYTRICRNLPKHIKQTFSRNTSQVNNRICLVAGIAGEVYFDNIYCYLFNVYVGGIGLFPFLFSSFPIGIGQSCLLR